MSRAAILHPATLLGKELRDSVERDPSPFTDLRLISTDETEVGNVTDGLGGAAFVLRADAEALEGVDVLFCCGALDVSRTLLAALPAGTTAIVVSPEATLDDGLPAVHGVSPAPSRGGVVVSPHPGVVALAHLLAPLDALGLVEASATVLQPASLYEESAFEEVFGQARALLTFSAKPEPAIFGRQLAFNLLPARDEGSVARQLGEVLATAPGGGGQAPPLAVQVLQAGVFHGLAVSLHVRLRRETTIEALEERLTASGVVSLPDDEDRPLLGPVDVAGRDELLLGTIRRDPSRPHAYWVWAVLDNLTRGGALNALALAKQLV